MGENSASTTQRPKASRAVFASAGSHYFSTVLALMAVVVILSNVGAAKGVTFGPIVTDGGFFLFPLAYILGDVISEVYGFKVARRAIVTTFALAAFSTLCFWIMIHLPAAEWYDGQAALERTLGPVWLIVLASLLGFLVGQTLNSWVLVKMKERFGERGLVGRLMGSTGVGEFADTLIFCSIAATVIGITDLPTFANYVLVGFVYKTAVEFLFVPVTTLVIRWFKRREPSYELQAATPGTPA
ncbi:queuosine precursor transporter [Paeniglutamicibacter sp. ABSL32-1]|uniref:queuosine precursor transporter n=1 Tax=Paeniglutamicibacter quisquiliarum TaxID=2849498 RepID=UPI001C2DE8DE|nr:queuosine precursor transporter [Paeniglutamicibacter quisquiliarum]MBV1780942.1 queuosine precursor transporter [Paeniglutamicibacter quisquiliarum]